jgi:hypothetical protein
MDLFAANSLNNQKERGNLSSKQSAVNSRGHVAHNVAAGGAKAAPRSSHSLGQSTRL